jgi:hypothetical protein
MGPVRSPHVLALNDSLLLQDLIASPHVLALNNSLLLHDLIASPPPHTRVYALQLDKP